MGTASREVIEVPEPIIEVLRLGHRPERDKRITTHVALVARAFGAKAIHIDTEDRKLERTIDRVSSMFGGNFRIKTGVKRRDLLRRWGGTIVHLTMYGTPVDEAVKEIPQGEKMIIIVGAEKVPRDIYELAHFNVSVGCQPHSEVAALAIFLDRLQKGQELDREMPGGMMKVLPNGRGKTVVRPGDGSPPPRAIDPFELDWPPVPDEETCIRVLSAVGCSNLVIAHCREVHRMGMDMVQTSRKEHPELKLDIDLALLEAGLLLHDIGRSRTHSIRHAVIGSSLVLRLGLDERIARMVRNHLGAGIPKEEAVDLGLPPEDLMPLTLMEKIVSHADNLVGEVERRPLSVPVEKLRAKGAEKAAERMIRLHNELGSILCIDLDRLI